MQVLILKLDILFLVDFLRSVKNAASKYFYLDTGVFWPPP